MGADVGLGAGVGLAVVSGIAMGVGGTTVREHDPASAIRNRQNISTGASLAGGALSAIAIGQPSA